MRLLIKLAIVATCFSSLLQAEWKPAYLSKEYAKKSIPALEDEEYQELKKQVKETLAGSWCSEEKVDLMMDLITLTRPKVCVEIGAFTGSSVLPVAATLKYLDHGKMYAVDAWSNEAATKYLTNSDPNKEWWSQVDMDAVHAIFEQMIENWSLKKFCIGVKATSEQAVNMIPDNIEFLHLDGDFSEAGSLKDVELFLPKVKSGGYILLSNLYIMIGRDQPKIQSFCALYEDCDYVCSIERDNAILFRKN